SISRSLPAGMSAEIIVVDDNSPDRTGQIAHEYSSNLDSSVKVLVIQRPSKLGLSSAILTGLKSASGAIVIVLDGDFSHPPQTIPHMIKELQKSECDIVIASRYVSGGSIVGWPFRRKLMSRGATKIAQYGLGVDVKDPMSGFFGFKRHIINDIKFDAIGFKMLLEMLVKIKGVRVREIPYSFTSRADGKSKVDASVVYDYLRAVYRLYRHGRSSAGSERRTSVRFLSKAGRFYTVGATGLLVNYALSTLLGFIFPSLWYIHGTFVGILVSITSNFFLNKLWTFEDRDFAAKKTAQQYGMFLGFSSLGALLQLSIVYALVESDYINYPIALIIGVAVASIGNFLLNKKWTFKEKIWS
ncbi:MAG: glycosyltransferase family 2 protein, partial [Nitrososphaera sp.]|nr:glycosyltransferase family 2 protein [Nitrososphaera sp.]